MKQYYENRTLERKTLTHLNINMNEFFEARTKEKKNVKSI